MVRRASVIRILVSCPSDVSAELDVVRQAVETWNVAHAAEKGVHLDVIHWQSHSTPELGDRPQAILNRQLVDTCDILIAVFWTRLGTPTGAARSGTVEEIEECQRKGKPVLIYFSDRPANPSTVDAEQYELVKSFKAECQTQGLISDYTSIEEFERLINRNLPVAIRSLPLPLIEAALIKPEDQREAVARGASFSATRLATAIGPLGGAVAVALGGGIAAPRRHGYVVATKTRSFDDLEQRGIMEIAAVAEEMWFNHGDGSKVAALVTASMIENGHRAIVSGTPIHKVVSGIEEAAQIAVAHVQETAELLSSKTDVFHVARTASGDAQIAQLIVDAIQKVGKNGLISIEEGSATRMDVKDGLRIRCGYLSQDFVTDRAGDRCELADALVLIYDGSVEAIRPLLPILESVKQTGLPLLMVTGGVEGDVLATLNVNVRRGVLRCAAIKVPWPAGQRRLDRLEDLAIYTGGRVISAVRGDRLESIGLADLGRAAQVMVSGEETAVIGGQGPANAIAERVRGLKAAVDRATDDAERQLLYERCAALDGSTAVITVAGVTPDETAELEYRAKTALHSSRAAIELGRVVGGGVAYALAGERLVEENRGRIYVHHCTDRSRP